jgi:hypothetical protein
VDRVVADDASSDVAMADSSAMDTRRSARESDTLYRRPPAQPPAESTSGGSWFTGGTELPAEEEHDLSEPVEPQYGPATPAGSNRTSFGFTAGPISPVRSSPSARQAAKASSAPAWQAADPSSAPPARQAGDRSSDPQGWQAGDRSSDPQGWQAGDRSSDPQGWQDGDRSFAPPVWPGADPAPEPAAKPSSAPPLWQGADPEPVRPEPALPVRRKGAAAAAEIAPISPSWPPPARLTPDKETLERVPGGPALRGPSGEFAEWRTPSGEFPLAGVGLQQRRSARPTSGGPSFGGADLVDLGSSEAGSPRTGSFGPRTGEQRRISEGTGEHRRVTRRDAPAEPLPPRQSRVVTVGMLVLTAIVLLAGTAVGIVYFSGSNETIDSVLQLGAGGSKNRVVTAPLDNRTTASFEMLAGANTVHVTIGELGDDLYRISTPDDAGFEPSPEIVNDDVKLQVTKDGDGTGGEIEVVLAAKVRWALRFSGYAETQLIDVSGGQVSEIEMVAGMRRAELTLPQPSGTVPLKINGSVDQMIVKSPVGSPVRIKVGGGAQTVVAGTRTLQNVAAGSTLTPKGWKTENRYDITAGARITSLTIENA